MVGKITKLIVSSIFITGYLFLSCNIVYATGLGTESDKIEDIITDEDTKENIKEETTKEENDEYKAEVEIVKVADIEIGNYEPELEVGKTQDISATVLPKDATDPTVKYASSNTNIATVNSSGQVKGVAPGSVTISIMSGSVTKNITLTVKVATTNINLNKSYLILKIGEEFKLSATVSPNNAAQNVTYKSSDDSIVTVSSNGTVKAKAMGNATIIVSNSDMSVAATIIVNENSTSSEELEDNKNSDTKQAELSEIESEIVNKIEIESVVSVKSTDIERITKSILKKLYEKNGELNIIADDYSIRIYGKDIVNYDNELLTLVEFIEESNGLSFIINDNNNLPGKVELKINNKEIKYVYLYNNYNGKYELLNIAENSELTLDEGGKYIITEEKISYIKIPIMSIAVAVSFIIIGWGIYILTKNKHWFW